MPRGRQPDPTTPQLVLAFLQRYIYDHGHPPTQEQIAVACHLSKTSVARGIDKLESWGYLRREHGTYRSLRLLMDGEEIR
jgi:DNA-binding MarR family transcriptional regulator